MPHQGVYVLDRREVLWVKTVTASGDASVVRLATMVHGQSTAAQMSQSTDTNLSNITKQVKTPQSNLY